MCECMEGELVTWQRWVSVTLKALLADVTVASL